MPGVVKSIACQEGDEVSYKNSIFCMSIKLLIVQHYNTRHNQNTVVYRPNECK